MAPLAHVWRHADKMALGIASDKLQEICHCSTKDKSILEPYPRTDNTNPRTHSKPEEEEQQQ
ncbi:hypothetical protein M513_08184 [Trichuris suis]|uniref:Uncharacterized protein n=1 Tax=Trichuris suis TaxID=68888 RepID=A0A085M0X5_9BILA|nr:hypothetical protein M513_08184 [Trichuris suis]